MSTTVHTHPSVNIANNKQLSLCDPKSIEKEKRFKDFWNWYASMTNQLTLINDNETENHTWNLPIVGIKHGVKIDCAGDIIYFVILLGCQQLVTFIKKFRYHHLSPAQWWTNLWENKI